MRILALETSDKTGGVAALDGCNVLAELTLDPNQRSAQSLAPAMKTLLEQVKWRPDDVQLVAVATGPGSFTGLRVGVTAAKVFAYSVGAEVLGVDTLEAIALNCASGTGCQISRTGCHPVLHVAMDAQRGDVVARTFEVKSPGATAGLSSSVSPGNVTSTAGQASSGTHFQQAVEPVGPQELIPADEWLRRLQPGSFVSGPALLRHAERLPPNVVALDREFWFPQASAVGRLAVRQYAAGRRDDIWKLVPRYCRRSAAEEKWDAMGK